MKSLILSTNVTQPLVGNNPHCAQRAHSGCWLSVYVSQGSAGFVGAAKRTAVQDFKGKGLDFHVSQPQVAGPPLSSHQSQGLLRKGEFPFQIVFLEPPDLLPCLQSLVCSSRYSPVCIGIYMNAQASCPIDPFS